MKPNWLAGARTCKCKCVTEQNGGQWKPNLYTSMHTHTHAYTRVHAHTHTQLHCRSQTHIGSYAALEEKIFCSTLFNLSNDLFSVIEIRHFGFLEYSHHTHSFSKEGLWRITESSYTNLTSFRSVMSFLWRISFPVSIIRFTWTDKKKEKKKNAY